MFEASKLVLQSALLRAADRLFFPKELKYYPVGTEIVVLSPRTANWLVIGNDDRCVLDMLTVGETIGSVSEWASKNNYTNSFRRIVSQIIYRKFASTDAPPLGEVDESVKNGAYFYLTNACNLRCSHCYMHSGAAEGNELKTEEWISLIDQFADIGGRSRAVALERHV